jgi:hypothetical protein
MFPRFLRPIQPTSRRAYSLFSKPPGGRFFNSSKPPKVVPSATPKSPTRVEASNDPSPPDDPSISPSPVPSSHPPHAPFAPTVLASHPPLSAPDLRLHQFFSQHRPLVLSQPAAVLFDASPTLMFGPTRTPSADPVTLDNPPETTPEADADTARLLARSLAMNAVSSSVSWDATLRRLGLDPDEGRAAESAALAVELDSTQRKRRRKMKKHKCALFFFSLSLILIICVPSRLKKRRRVRNPFPFYHRALSSDLLFQLQRAQRMKIGR